MKYSSKVSPSSVIYVDSMNLTLERVFFPSLQDIADSITLGVISPGRRTSAIFIYCPLSGLGTDEFSLYVRINIRPGCSAIRWNPDRYNFIRSAFGLHFARCFVAYFQLNFCAKRTQIWKAFISTYTWKYCTLKMFYIWLHYLFLAYRSFEHNLSTLT